MPLWSIEHAINRDAYLINQALKTENIILTFQISTDTSCIPPFPSLLT